MITYERIVRMENLAGNTSLLDQKAYDYIPQSVYTSVLESLTKIAPPKYNSNIEYTVFILINMYTASI